MKDTIGWAYGTVGWENTYLSIPGAMQYKPKLYETEVEAEVARKVRMDGGKLVTRLVQEVRYPGVTATGVAYRIIHDTTKMTEPLLLVQRDDHVMEFWCVPPSQPWMATKQLWKTKGSKRIRQIYAVELLEAYDSERWAPTFED